MDVGSWNHPDASRGGGGVGHASGGGGHNEGSAAMVAEFHHHSHGDAPRGDHRNYAYGQPHPPAFSPPQVGPPLPNPHYCSQSGDVGEMSVEREGSASTLAVATGHSSSLGNGVDSSSLAAMPPHHLSPVRCVKNEIHNILTVLRLSKKFTSKDRFHGEVARDRVNPLVVPFQQLFDSLTYVNEFHVDVSLLQPFLAVIRSRETSGPISGVALGAVNKFVAYGLIDPSKPGCEEAINAIASGVLGCKFQGTGSAADEVTHIYIYIEHLYIYMYVHAHVVFTFIDTWLFACE
eukprot:GHVU01218642.1.p1 GENE.GHVU01218642.1~~GHVU01218642.1.p1  ORF type:complete len:291 (-),score=28.58 GHVU01218642.1:330-1202(-)